MRTCLTCENTANDSGFCSSCGCSKCGLCRQCDCQCRKPLRLTRRGKIVLALAILTPIIAFTYATRDTCWTGQGYGSCTVMLDRVVEQGQLLHKSELTP